MHASEEEKGRLPRGMTYAGEHWKDKQGEKHRAVMWRIALKQSQRWAGETRVARIHLSLRAGAVPFRMATVANHERGDICGVRSLSRCVYMERDNNDTKQWTCSLKLRGAL